MTSIWDVEAIPLRVHVDSSTTVTAADDTGSVAEPALLQQPPPKPPPTALRPRLTLYRVAAAILLWCEQLSTPSALPASFSHPPPSQPSLPAP